MNKIAGWINETIETVKDEKLPTEKLKRSEFIKNYKKRIVKNVNLLAIAKEVKELTKKHPVYK